MWDALHDLVPIVQLKKRENTHEGVLLLVMLQASSSWSFKVKLMTF